MQFSFAVPAQGNTHQLPSMPAGLDSAALAQLALNLKASKTKTPLVVVTSNAFDAQRLLEEIPWFAPHLVVNLLPDWETLPYDHFSPHPDLISERINALSNHAKQL